MKKTTMTISTLLILVFLAGTVYAWGPGHGRGMKGNGPGENCQGYGTQGKFTNLTKEQQDELNTLRQKFIDDTYELRSSAFKVREDIRMLMQTSDPDRAKLVKMHDEASELRKQIQLKRLDFALAAKKIAPELNLGQGGPGMGKKGRHFAGKGSGRYNGGGNPDCPRR